MATSGHRRHLADLGFPGTVATEAGRAADRGRFALRPSPDLGERIMDRFRSAAEGDARMRVGKVEDIPAEARDAYWSLVTRTVTEVVKGDAAVVGRHRWTLASGPPWEQLLAYRQSPLAVAVDLCGAVATPAVQVAYAALASEDAFAVLDGAPGIGEGS